MCRSKLRCRTYLIIAILAAALACMIAACYQPAQHTGASAEGPGSVTELLSGPRIVATDNTALRQDPSADATLLELLQEGDVVQLQAASGDGIWYRVNAEPDGREGWLLADLVVEAAGTGRVTALGLNLRAGPGTAYPVKTVVAQDERVDVLAQAFDCTWLRVVGPGGMTGWVARRYVEFSPPCGVVPQAARLPQLPSAPSSTAVPFAQTTPTPRQGLMDAPRLLDPPDGAIYAEPGQVVLRWSPVDGQLAQDEYYLITINFRHSGQLWTDYAFTAETEWPLTQHSYLLDVADNDLFAWSVHVLRATGMSEDGVPTGDVISERSGARQFAIAAGAPPSAGRTTEPESGLGPDVGLGPSPSPLPAAPLPAAPSPALPTATAVAAPVQQPPTLPPPIFPTSTFIVSGQEWGTPTLTPTP